MLLDPRPVLLRPATPSISAWWPAAACLALAALTLLLPTTPSYDPWAWIVWGREITQGELNTVFGPSWKPLPILFTVPFALAGDAAPDLWVWIARAATLGALVVAYRIGARLGGPLAGAAGALLLGLAPWWVRLQALGHSEGMLVLCGLLAVDRHLAGHRGQAYALGVAAGLLRPEAWPFLGLYGLWLAWQDRRRLPWLAGGLVAMLALWVLPEYWGSGNLFRAAERANDPNPGTAAFAERPSLVVLGDFVRALGPVGSAGLVLAALAARTRGATAGARRLAAWLAGLGVAWLALVAAMTEAGFSGNLRYLIMPVALAFVLAGAGFAWAAGALAMRAGRAGGRRAVAAGAALLVAAAVTAHGAAHLPSELRRLHYDARLRASLPVAIERAGGAQRLLACGDPYAGPFVVPMVAWELGVHASSVRLEPEPPAVVLRAEHLAGAQPLPPPGRPPGATTLGRSALWEIEGACR